MRTDLVHLGGRVVPVATARIDPRDPAVSAGQALIETLAVLDGVPRLVEAHLARLASAEAALGWPITAPEVVQRALLELIAAASVRDGALRVLRSPGPPGGGATLLVEVRALPVLPAGPRTAEVERGGWAQPAGIDELKHTGRLARTLLRDRARRAGHLDCLMVDGAGRLLEATAANVVVVTQGRARTPPVAFGVLPGVVRGILVGLGALIEDSLRVEDLERADEVVLTSSLLGCVGLDRIQGGSRSLPGARGPALARLRALLGDAVPSPTALGATAPPAVT